MTTTPRQERWAEAVDVGPAADADDWAWPTPWIERPSPAVVAPGPGRGPSALLRLFVEQGQSPWLDRFTRADVEDGSLARLVAAGVRGVTTAAVGSGFAGAVSTEHDEQLSWLLTTGCTVEEAYRELVVTDVLAACAILRPVYETSQAMDGFVSLKVTPVSLRRTRAELASVRRLHQRIDRPNLLVAVPATAEAVAAIRSLVAEGRSINATSIFSLDRYSAVIDAYLSGLEAFVAEGGDPATVHGVASFCVGEVDDEVDMRLENLATARVHGRDAGLCELSGLAGVAQAKFAYRLFEERFSTDRWVRLARLGANPQRLLWAPSRPGSGSGSRVGRDVGYVEQLIAPGTVHVLSASAVAAFEDHGVVERSLDTGRQEAAQVLSELAAVGIDLDEVAAALEDQCAHDDARDER